jgi:hypothetical protein
LGFVAEVNPKAGLGFKASDAFTVSGRELHPLESSAFSRRTVTPTMEKKMRVKVTYSDI